MKIIGVNKLLRKKATSTSAVKILQLEIQKKKITTQSGYTKLYYIALHLRLSNLIFRNTHMNRLQLLTILVPTCVCYRYNIFFNNTLYAIHDCKHLCIIRTKMLIRNQENTSYCMCWSYFL